MVQLLKSAHTALASILDFWMERTPDPEGGFIGRMDADNKIVPGAPKGAVLNARILWTFSAAFRANNGEAYRQMADRAYHYFRDHFVDPVHGGVFWSVDAEGRPLDTKKQIYAIAFAIYGLSEYYAATGHPTALETAIRLYRDIEQRSFDERRGGYLEAFSRDWGRAGDMRLSAKDANEAKTMNTHLHILEAYTNLYRVWKDPYLERQLRALVQVFRRHIIDPVSYHLILFFDEDWNPRSKTISFGHDIEASWLLCEAAVVLGLDVNTEAMQIAVAAREGLAVDGSMYNEYDDGHWNRERHWWVQAEAMVGFVNAWQISGEPAYFEDFERTWTYIDRFVIDHLGGEWRWGLKEDNTPMPGEDKVGMWKGPYHNGRALMELIRRLDPGGDRV